MYDKVCTLQVPRGYQHQSGSIRKIEDGKLLIIKILLHTIIGLQHIELLAFMRVGAIENGTMVSEH